MRTPIELIDAKLALLCEEKSPKNQREINGLQELRDEITNGIEAQYAALMLLGSIEPYTKEEIDTLGDLLNDCLEGANQENSFVVRGVEDGKLVVEFNIVSIPDEKYLAFSGY